MLLCPYCEYPLEEDGVEVYQDLTEHVCNPNSESPPKEIYRCKNAICIGSKLKGYWGWDGGWYSHDKNEWEVKEAITKE